MQSLEVMIGGRVAQVLASSDAAAVLEARFATTRSRSERIDYIVGGGEEASGPRRPNSLDHGTCRILRHDDPDLLVAALEAHVENLTRPAGVAPQYLGAALVRGEQAFLVPVDVLSTSGGLVRKLINNGWKIDVGSRVRLDGRGVVLDGSRVDRVELASPGEYVLAAIVLDGRYGTGVRRIDLIAHVLRSLDATTGLDASAALEAATTIVDSDTRVHIWDNVDPRSIVSWIEQGVA